MKEINQYEVFNFERKLMWINGLYHGTSFPKRKAQDVSSAIWILSLTTFLCCMVGKIVEQSDDYELIFEISQALLTFGSTFVKVLYFRYNLPRFNALEESLKAPIFNRRSFEQESFMRRAIFDFGRLIQTYWLLVFVTGTALSTFSLLNEKIWAVPIWTPLGDGRSGRAWAQAFEMVCFGLLATAGPGADIIPVVLMNVMWAQLKILNDNLRNVTERDLREDAAVQEERVQDRLRKCIDHHLAIISFVSHLEEIFSFGLFIQIFTSVIAICMTALQFLQTSADVSTLVTVAFFLLTLLTQIGMFCLIGQKLITEDDLLNRRRRKYVRRRNTYLQPRKSTPSDLVSFPPNLADALIFGFQSDRIGESCYMSEWYACTTSTKKMFFIVMERAKRPIAIRGGNFFEISLLTFVMIIRNAYSVFTLLMQLYS